MRRSLTWLLPALALGACTDGPARLFILPPEGEGGYSLVPVGFGGQAGMPTTQPPAGAGGQAGQAPGGAGVAGSLSPIAGAAGQGGAACADAPSPSPLTSCETASVGSCAACLCQSTTCEKEWSDCADDARCLRAARCLALGCPATECSTLAGASQVLLLPVATCLVSDTCASACSASGSSAGASGSTGAGTGGASGQSGAAGGTAAGGTSAGLPSAGGAGGEAPVPPGGAGGAGGEEPFLPDDMVAGQGGVAGADSASL